MSKQLFCAGCSKSMGTVRDASLRKGMVVYCSGCNEMLSNVSRQSTKPDFYKHLEREWFK